ELLALLVGDDAAEDEPVTVVATGREGPVTVDDVAAVDGAADALRCVGRCGPDIRTLTVGAPDVGLQARVALTELEGVHAHDARDPRRRRRDGADLVARLDELGGVRLVAAEVGVA